MAPITFWRRMQQLTGNGGPPPFLATQPSTAQRIEELLDRLPELGNGAGLHDLRHAIAMVAS